MADEIKLLDLHPDPVSLASIRQTNNENYKKINGNFGAIKTIPSQISAIEKVADEAKQEAIEAITKADDTQSQLNKIIQAQTSGEDVVPEVVQARGDFLLLGERLDDFDNKLNDPTTNAKMPDSREVYIDKFPIIGGEVDDSGRFYRAVQSLNGKGTIIFSPKEYVIGSKVLLSSESSDITLYGYGAVIKQAIKQYTETHFLTMNGSNIRIIGITFDGQQWEMTDSTYGTGGLAIRGDNPFLLDVSTINFNGQGCSLANFSGGSLINCHFDDNVKLGMEIISVRNVNFQLCTFNRNGYGFQKRRTNYGDESHDRLSFGLAIRFRSSNLRFESCKGNDNGRDGLNVNQGSYDIRFIQCECNGNDDGGFTIAADDTSTGRLGEGESPYDIHFVNCEGSNNFTSGLAAYQPVYGLQVIGGNYFNNHRVAGTQTETPSFFNGIFVASGSKDVSIRGAFCYDDRQSAKVTDNMNSPTFTVESWFVGTKDNYPRVAVIDGKTKALKGYANITDETSTSVTLANSAFNGVGLSNIAIGDIITQAVQRFGCRFDNSCSGVVDVYGFGNIDDLLYVGSYENDQNVKIVNSETNNVNLFLNGTFDDDTVNPPASWNTNIGAGGAQALETTIAKSKQSYKLTAGTNTLTESSGGLRTDYLNRVKGSYVRFGAMVKTTGEADIILYSNHGGITKYSRAKHSGNGKWQYLELWVYCRDSLTSLTPRIRALSGSAYFDNLTLDVHQPRYTQSERPQRGLPY